MKAFKIIFGVSLLFPGFLLAAAGTSGSSQMKNSYQIDDAVAGHGGKGRTEYSESIPGHGGNARVSLEDQSRAIIESTGSIEFNLNGQNYFCYPSSDDQFYE